MIAMSLDPVLLARHAGLDPDDWQAAALRSRAPRALWNCCRQSGKTSVAAVLAVHQALFTPRSLTLLVSPSLRQSQEAMSKVVAIYTSTGRSIPPETENKLTLELASGSRIVALPGSEKTTRGYSAPSLIIIDEASRVDDELFFALTPMVATNPAARLLAISTPNGQLGWWHAAWVEEGEVWEKVRITACDCPRISESFLATERMSMPASTYAQEYECTFSAIQDGAFRPEDIYAMVSESVLPRFPALAAALSGGEPPPPGDVDLTPYLS